MGTMIRLHAPDGLREFADAQAIIDYFELTNLPEETFAGIKAASDAGFPLYACTDPFSEEIHNTRYLMLDNDPESLRRECMERQNDI